MKLRDYLKKHNITQEKFAELIGVTRPWVTCIVNEQRNPSINVIIAIEKVTNGEVTTKDLFNPKAPSRPTRKKKKESEYS